MFLEAASVHNAYILQIHYWYILKACQLFMHALLFDVDRCVFRFNILSQSYTIKIFFQNTLRKNSKYTEGIVYRSAFGENWWCMQHTNGLPCQAWSVLYMAMTLPGKMDAARDEGHLGSSIRPLIISITPSLNQSLLLTRVQASFQTARPESIWLSISRDDARSLICDTLLNYMVQCSDIIFWQCAQLH